MEYVLKNSVDLNDGRPFDSLLRRILNYCCILLIIDYVLLNIFFLNLFLLLLLNFLKLLLLRINYFLLFNLHLLFLCYWSVNQEKLTQQQLMEFN
jgi:hypothetical protein